ncbi:MAG TPA: hypothetical protein VH062_02245 [Polyangiaceae bacterium]|jgi:phage gpG-like protein|nr:hypothetical protein [Polyangiaceae bacterium]
MVKVGFDTSELDGVLDEWIARGGNVRALMPSAAQVLVDAVDYEFYSEGRGQWKPSLRALLEGGKTLNDTGVLAGSIQPDYGEDWATAFTDVPYGVYHLPPEKSGHSSKGIMPVRDFLDIDIDGASDEIVDLFLREVIG